jgi:hypothetical protein
MKTRFFVIGGKKDDERKTSGNQRKGFIAD